MTDLLPDAGIFHFCFRGCMFFVFLRILWCPDHNLIYNETHWEDLLEKSTDITFITGVLAKRTKAALNVQQINTTLLYFQVLWHAGFVFSFIYLRVPNMSKNTTNNVNIPYVSQTKIVRLKKGLKIVLTLRLLPAQVWAVALQSVLLLVVTLKSMNRADQTKLTTLHVVPAEGRVPNARN